MRGSGLLRKGIALLAVACASTVGAAASAPLVSGWKANPDEQFLLDVNLRQLRLGDGVRAYQTPGGTCLVFGDFLAALDVPMKIDLAAKKASGWAFKEDHSITIDLASAQVSYGNAREPLATGTVHETPEGWCVDSRALSRWFALDVKPLMSGSALVIESEAKLPVELAIERKHRAEQLKSRASFDLKTLPQVRLPYRLWQAPALDFVVSAGATYRADTGVRVDRRASVHAAGEIARLSYESQMWSDEKGRPEALRMRAYRSDPDGGLLGPLQATHVGFGDVAGLDTRLGGSAAQGRGAVVTNRPLLSPAAFDRTRFEGDLPPGWEAEIYRNGELVAFAKPTSDQRYVFDDVQLFYGENRVEVILYGPQGQVRSREELINVGRDNVPAGKTWYWAGINQPGKDVLALRDVDERFDNPDLQAAVSAEHGLDSRTTLGAVVRMLLEDDERITFAEGSVRRSVGPALIEVGAAHDSRGGTAARAQLLAKVGSVNLSADALITDEFHLRQGRPTSGKDMRLSIDAPLRIGRAALPAHADVRVTEAEDGSRQLEAAARLSASIQRFNLATDLRYRRQYLAQGPAPPGELEMTMLGTGRIGDVRLRGSATAVAAPDAHFRSAELSAYWSASDSVDWEGAIAYDADRSRARARITHVRRLDTLAVALTGEAATDGSLAVGLNLNFSLDPRRGIFSRQPLAGAGVIHARVYRDLNDNGLRDKEEPLEPGALITTGTRVVEKTTDDRGAVMIGGLATFVPIAVGIDSSSLPDPMLVPRKALQVVTPRPGIPVQVEIGLVGAGDIEGALVKSGGIGFEGVELELVGADGKSVATTITDFDGFFLFERAPYGTYKLRVTPASAAAARITADLNVQVTVGSDQPIARLGTIPVTSLPQIALASP